MIHSFIAYVLQCTALDNSMHKFQDSKVLASLTLKFRYSEKATKFEKMFHLNFDVTEQRQKSGRFFQILWPSQNIRTLRSYYETFLEKKELQDQLLGEKKVQQEKFVGCPIYKTRMYNRNLRVDVLYC